MTGRRLRAFVSSRMQELSAERAAIKSALNQLLVDAWVFEADAGARPGSIQQTYLQEVEDADFYIGVFWKGYGQYTIDEFEHARQRGKDCFIYEKRVDLDGRDPELAEFLNRIGSTTTGLTIHRFDDIQEIGGFVVEDVARWQAEVIRRRASRRGPRVFQAPPLSDQYVERTDLLRRCLGVALDVDERGFPRVSRLALQGGGGAGKSVMAAALAHREEVQGRFEDGVLWASLGKTPNLKEILSGWGLALHDSAMPVVGYGDTQTGTNQLRSLLQDRACLLVVDDVWDDAHVSSAMLVGGPRCVLLITCRGIAIADRLKATTVSLDMMTPDESLDLLSRWTGELNETESAAGVAATLAGEVGYLPLALELIGAQVRRLGSWARFQQRWNEKRLESLRRDRGARGPDNSLEDSIQLSVDALAREDHVRYVMLGVFPGTGSFTAGAAAALWSLDGDDAAELLEDLAGRALLTRRAQDGRDRFSFHSLLHAFVVERLGAAGIRTAHQRLIEGYRRQCADGWASGPDDGYFFEGLSNHLASSGTPADVYTLVDERWMAAQYARRFSHRSFAKDVEAALNVARAAVPLDLPSIYRCSLVISTLDLLSQQVPPALMGVLVRLGESRRAQELAASITDPTNRSRAWRSIADAGLPAGALQDVANAVAEAEAAATAIATPEMRVEELVAIAGLLDQLHDAAGACRVAALADASWPQIEVPFLRASIAPALARVFMQIGEPDAAASLAERLQRHAASAAYQSLLVLGPLAQVAQVCGAIDMLRRAEETALRLRAQGMGDDYVPDMTAAFGRLGHIVDANRVAATSVAADRRARAFATLATLQFERGDTAAALAALDEAVGTVEREESARIVRVFDPLLRLSAAAGRPDHQARILTCMSDAPGSISRARVLALQALAAVQRDALAEAGNLANRVVAAMQEIVSRDPAPWLDDLTGAVALLGEAGLFDAAIQAAACIHDPATRNEALAGVAQSMIGRGDATRARDTALAVLTSRPEVEAGLPSVKALVAVALALNATGEPELARQAVTRLVPAAAAVRDGPGSTGSDEALATVARVAHRLGVRDVAIACARKALGSVGTGRWLRFETSTLVVFGAAAEVLDDSECEQALSAAQDEPNLARAAVAEITEGLMRRGCDRRAGEFVEMVRAQALPLPPWNQAVTGEVFVELARLNDSAAVDWVVARARHLRANEPRARALGVAAATLWRMGRHQDAERLLPNALEAAAKLPDDDHSLNLMMMATELADASAPGLAIDISRQALAVPGASSMIGPVVQALVRAGNADVALTLSLEIEPGSHRDDAIGGFLCRELLDRGDLNRVLAISSEHLSRWGAAYFDAQVAIVLAKAGDALHAGERAQSAASALESIAQGPGRSVLQALLARACAAMGQFTEAREWVRAAADEIEDTAGLLTQSWLSSALIDVGDLSLAQRHARQALAIADGLTSRLSFLRARDDLTSAGLRSGGIQPEELMDLAGRGGDEWARASDLAALYTQLPREQTAVVLNRVKELKDQWAMAHALGELATAMAKAGDHDGLLLTLEAQGTLKWSWAGGAALGRIAAAAATAGMPDVLSQALAILRDAATPAWRRAGGLALVAQALSGAPQADERQNLIRQALDEASGSHDMNEMDLAVHAARLGLALTHLGDRESAIALANDAHESLSSINWYWRRYVLDGLMPLAAALGEPERLERLLPFAEPSAGEGPIAEVRSSWALELAKSGAFERARAEADRVVHQESTSPVALGTAAAALFFAGARERALEVTADAMMKARVTSREALAGALEAVAPGLSHMNERESLKQIEEIDREVSGWWEAGHSTAARASQAASGG